ncbi:DUF262 domain-containing protein [Flammeovirga sp. OC4]|uniref:DUF262 domain-containing protein n=1 Tax=Flammeovirga sp. OC4 TaxID=1382345 RepID=UPI000694819B|nr:DUF262 domain-containing protein [Flammeovirga sp. OC4]
MNTTVANANQEILADKINISTLFSDFWFRVPEYQRSYVWGNEQIDELLDDLNYAINVNPNKEYFLGSVVLQKHSVQSNNVSFECCDILDGQQRMTTLFLLMAVLRDISTNDNLKKKARESIFQNEDIFSNQPERIRIEFLIRDEVADFVNNFVKTDGGTDNANQLKQYSTSKNVSLKNMANSMLYLREQFEKLTPEALNKLAVFLFQKVIVIYVASESLEDAFRLFTILNDRGIPLSNSDILKSLNIGEVQNTQSRQRFALMWEKLEGEFGRDDFDRFLGHIRTIITKEKARENLLKEYEKIYESNLLAKGEPTLSLIHSYRDIYAKLIWFDDEVTTDFKLRNLITVMKRGLASDWIPLYLAYYKKFEDQNLLQFAEKLESKFSADWILQETPTKRLTNSYSILKAIEKYKTPEELLQDEEVFKYDREELENRLSGEVYGKNFARYILLKLEYLMLESNQAFSDFNKISVEHVLPQKPKDDSQWKRDFSDEDREEWTHKIANLVLLSRIKNSQLNNKDYTTKK